MYSGLSTAGLVYAVSRGLYIRPERVHRETFYQVKNSLFLREAMGITVMSPMKAGIMRVSCRVYSSLIYGIWPV